MVIVKKLHHIYQVEELDLSDLKLTIVGKHNKIITNVQLREDLELVLDLDMVIVHVQQLLPAGREQVGATGNMNKEEREPLAQRLELDKKLGNITIVCVLLDHL